LDIILAGTNLQNHLLTLIQGQIFLTCNEN
jgi:hypothetical protein